MPKLPEFVIAVLFLLFVASAVVGMQVAYDPSLSRPVLLALLISVSLFFVVAYSPLSPWRVAQFLVLAAGLLAFYFLAQYSHFDYKYEVGFLPNLGRMTGSWLPKIVFFVPHPNAVASFLEGIFLVSLVIVWRAPAKTRWIWLILTAVMAYALLISESRGAWVGMAAAMGIGILLVFRARALPFLAIMVGLGIGIIAGTYVVFSQVSPGQEIPFITPTLHTVDSRLTLYRDSFRLLKDYFFTGIGPGDTFGMIYSRYQLFFHVPFLTYAHNIFLSVGLGQGLLGMVTLVGLLLAFYAFVVRVEYGGINKPARMLFRAAWLGVTASLIHGLTDSAQYSEAVWTMPMLFAVAGIAVHIGRQNTDRTSASFYPINYRWNGVAVLLATIALAVLVAVGIFWRPVLGAWYANWGSVYQAKADLSAGLDEAAREALTVHATGYFNKALEFDPHQATANQRLGLMALEQQEFEAAITYLENAYAQEPADQGTWRTLAYAYLWTGRLDDSETLFRELDVISRYRVISQLDYWTWLWGTQNQENLAGYAADMKQRLTPTIRW